MGIASPYGCGKHISTPPMRRVDFVCGQSWKLCSDCIANVDTHPVLIEDCLDDLQRMAEAFIDQGDGEWADVPRAAAELIQALVDERGRE